MKSWLLTGLFVLITAFAVQASPPPDSCFLRPSETYNPKRMWWVGGIGGTLYAGTLIALNSLWYSDFPRSSFHFFNDNEGWLQQDKIGHLWTSYVAATYGHTVMDWTGLEDRKAIWIGAMVGPLFLTTIEILDGFSAEWGASVGDLIANSLGSGIYIAQELIWEEQRIQVKLSWHPVTYYPLFSNRARDLFGVGVLERLFKDYNGQSYWLSINPRSFSPGFPAPKWLNIGLGYSVDGLLGAERNMLLDENEVILEDYSSLPRTRQYFLSLDIDLRRIKTRSQLLRTILGALNAFKIPAPALEINSKGKVRVHALYY